MKLFGQGALRSKGSGGCVSSSCPAQQPSGTPLSSFCHPSLPNSACQSTARGSGTRQSSSIPSPLPPCIAPALCPGSRWQWDALPRWLCTGACRELTASSHASPFSLLLALYPCNIHTILSLPFCCFIAPQPALGEQSPSGTHYLLEGTWYIALIMRTTSLFIFFFSKPYKYV